jgi:hypothetical protein
MCYPPSPIVQAATPYAVLTAGIGIAGATVALTAVSTPAIVAGVALAFFGSYGLIGVISCAYRHSDNADQFRENIHLYMLTAATAVVAEMLRIIAEVVIRDVIRNCLDRRRA